MTIDQIEWTWTLVNAAGIVFLGRIIRDLWRDHLASRQEVLDALGLTNGRRGIWVMILLRHESFFVVLQALLLWAGIAAILRPNPTDPAAIESTVTAGTFWILFPLGMDLMAFLDLRDRSRIRNYKALDERHGS